MRTVPFKPTLLSVLALLALPTAAALAATPGAGQPAAQTQSGSATGGAAPTQAAATAKPTLATWFGPGFYGNTTACGQTMTPALVGVASRTLPCGTLVQIGYRGHTLTVPVLDRGPYGHIGAVWDLTAGAARALKIKDTVRIRTQIVGSVPNALALGLPPGSTAPAGSTPPAGATPAQPASSATAATAGGASAG
jgi:rare lipoprotein A (peptidoglycan hydrolase)